MFQAANKSSIMYHASVSKMDTSLVWESNLLKQNVKVPDLVEEKPSRKHHHDEDKVATVKRHCPLKEAASRQRPDGRMALHILCQKSNASLESVSSLLEAYPEAAQKRDVYGRTPLFYALKRNCSLEVVELLLEAFPEAIEQSDFCGTTPLNVLYQKGKSSQLLQSVLNKKPSLAFAKSKNFSGQVLLNKVSKKWLQMDCNDNNVVSEVQTNPELVDQWEKLVLTVRAAYSSRFGESQKIDLEAALELSQYRLLSHKIVLWIIAMNPQLAQLDNRQGMLPLHWVLTSKSLENRRDVVTGLLQAYPEAASTAFQNKLPLFLAIENGVSWNDGLQTVLYAAPHALHTTQSGMLPFMVSACADNELNTIFNLLKEGPTL